MAKMQAEIKTDESEILESTNEMSESIPTSSFEGKFFCLLELCNFY
jgi:hypothetical protein